MAAPLKFAVNRPKLQDLVAQLDPMQTIDKEVQDVCTLFFCHSFVGKLHVWGAGRRDWARRSARFEGAPPCCAAPCLLTLLLLLLRFFFFFFVEYVCFVLAGTT